MSRADTVALVSAVARYANDVFKIGPRIAVARTTASSPRVPITSVIQAGVVASDPHLSAVGDAYSVRQACDTLDVNVSLCHLADVDGAFAVQSLRMFPDTAEVEIEYWMNRKVRGTRELGYGTGTIHFRRNGADWRPTGSSSTTFGRRAGTLPVRQ